MKTSLKILIVALSIFATGCYTQVAMRGERPERNDRYAYEDSNDQNSEYSEEESSDEYYEDNQYYDDYSTGQDIYIDSYGNVSILNSNTYSYMPYRRYLYGYYPSVGVSLSWGYDPWYYNYYDTYWGYSYYMTPGYYAPWYYPYSYYSPWYYPHYNNWNNYTAKSPYKYRTNDFARTRGRDGERNYDTRRNRTGNDRTAGSTSDGSFRRSSGRDGNTVDLNRSGVSRSGGNTSKSGTVRDKDNNTQIPKKGEAVKRERPSSRSDSPSNRRSTTPTRPRTRDNDGSSRRSSGSSSRSSESPRSYSPPDRKSVV